MYLGCVGVCREPDKDVQPTRAGGRKSAEGSPLVCGGPKCTELVSVSSLVLRKSLISSAKVAMVSAQSRSCRLCCSVGSLT